MLGCLSVNADSPERLTNRGGEESEIEPVEAEQNGSSESSNNDLGPSSNQAVGSTLASTSARQTREGASDQRQSLANNASRRSLSSSNNAAGSSRRRSSIRNFCKRLGKFFQRRSSSSSSAPTTAYLGFDSRTRLRSEFRQRILGALSSIEPTFVSAGSHTDRHNGEEITSVLRRRRLSERATRGEIISQSDQVWREIQDFAISQQGDVYVYIPYTHLDEALSYLSQILPILSLSLREHQKQEEGLTREEFEELPILKEEEVEDLCITDCSVCFNPMKADEQLVRLPCFEDHVFHKACLWKWLSSHRTCPICRAKVEIPEKEEDCEHCDHCEHCEHEDEHELEHEQEHQGQELASTSTINSHQGSLSHANVRSFEIDNSPNTSRRIFIWSTARSSTPAMLILSRGQRG